MIRLFVGTSANSHDSEAEAVLEWTARKHCSMPLEITWMRQAEKGPWSGWESAKRGRTPFTAYRWSLPAVCNYEGKALYTDVDFFFRADLAELWNQPIPSVGLVRNATGKLSTSCILFDCAKARGHVPTLDVLKRMPDAHDKMLHYFRSNIGLLTACEGNWDCSHFEKDVYGKMPLDDPRVKAVHYTRVESQLHLKHAIPRLAKEGRKHWYVEGGAQVFNHPRQDLQALFDDLYAEALANGYTLDKYRVQPYGGAKRREFAYSAHVGEVRA